VVILAQEVLVDLVVLEGQVVLVDQEEKHHLVDLGNLVDLMVQVE
jgi:hypothetical protein